MQATVSAPQGTSKRVCRHTANCQFCGSQQQRTAWLTAACQHISWPWVLAQRLFTWQLLSCTARSQRLCYAATRSMAGLRSRIFVFFAESCAWSNASASSVARSYLRLHGVNGLWHHGLLFTEMSGTCKHESCAHHGASKPTHVLCADALGVGDPQTIAIDELCDGVQHWCHALAILGHPPAQVEALHLRVTLHR